MDRRALRRLAGVVAVLPCLAAAGCAGRDDASQTCTLGQVADLPVLNDRGSPVVRAAIDGQPVAFIVDTGAFLSVIGSDDASRLELPISFDKRYLIAGIGGSAFAPDATIRELSLGTAVARDVPFAAIGAFPRHVEGLKVVGLFGGDFLANYDVDLDLPAHRVGLYVEQAHCGRHMRPWADPFYELPFDLNNRTEIDVRIGVEDKQVDAQLDSGADHTQLDADAGAVAGATAATMAADRKTMSTGIDGNPVPGHLHRFASLTIGPERFAPAYLIVNDAPRTLLGTDFLRRHRVWISYPHEMLYIEPAARVGPPTTAINPSR